MARSGSKAVCLALLAMLVVSVAAEVRGLGCGGWCGWWAGRRAEVWSPHCGGPLLTYGNRSNQPCHPIVQSVHHRKMLFGHWFAKKVRDLGVAIKRAQLPRRTSAALRVVKRVLRTPAPSRPPLSPPSTPNQNRSTTTPTASLLPRAPRAPAARAAAARWTAAPGEAARLPSGACPPLAAAAPAPAALAAAAWPASAGCPRRGVGARGASRVMIRTRGGALVPALPAARGRFHERPRCCSRTSVSLLNRNARCVLFQGDDLRPRTGSVCRPGVASGHPTNLV
jgi:hypothetical protein